MSISKLFARLATVAACAWAGSSASAADVAPPAPAAAPVVVGAAPVIEAAPGCPTCQGGGAVAGCSTCGKKCGGIFQKHKPPFQVTLCPGACFGYFQTQWRKWDDVCPYPYLGTGVSDAMRLPGAAGQQKGGPGTAPAPMPKAGELNPPRPIDPKMPEPKAPTTPAPKKAGSDLPVIPPMPPAPGKFVP